MSQSSALKIFDLADAPLDVQQGEEFSALRPCLDDAGGVLMAVVVGHYECELDIAGYDTVSREVTYSVYRLHLWLLDNGAGKGEPVLLRWTAARSNR